MNYLDLANWRLSKGTVSSGWLLSECLEEQFLQDGWLLHTVSPGHPDKRTGCITELKTIMHRTALYFTALHCTALHCSVAALDGSLQTADKAAA